MVKSDSDQKFVRCLGTSESCEGRQCLAELAQQIYGNKLYQKKDLRQFDLTIIDRIVKLIRRSSSTTKIPDFKISQNRIHNQTIAHNQIVTKIAPVRRYHQGQRSDELQFISHGTRWSVRRTYPCLSHASKSKTKATQQCDCPSNHRGTTFGSRHLSASYPPRWGRNK